MDLKEFEILAKMAVENDMDNPSIYIKNLFEGKSGDEIAHMDPVNEWQKATSIKNHKENNDLQNLSMFGFNW